MKLPAASHSFHSAWRQCPRKAFHTFVARDVEREESDALRWGLQVHEALERHISDGEPLPEPLQSYAHLYDFPSGYLAHAEVKLGIDREGRACDFFADEVYARGVLDVVLLSPSCPDVALLIDHKTGKVREDDKELRFHAMLLHAHYPELTTIKGWYNWLSAGRMGVVYDLSDTAGTLREIRQQQKQIEHAYGLGPEAFAPRQGPLCGYCPCHHCEYHP